MGIVHKLFAGAMLVGAPGFAGHALAAPVPTTVTASSSSYSGSLSLLNDGVVPLQGSAYNWALEVHDYGSTTFNFSFGGVKTITDLFASVDNNDDYTITFLNGTNSVYSYVIHASDGTINNGMDSFSTYGAANSTTLGGSFLITADHAVISTSGGDGLYAIGEVDFFNNAAVTVTGPAPEPATWAMMIVGFGLAGLGLRRQVRRSGVTVDTKIKSIAGGEAIA